MKKILIVLFILTNYVWSSIVDEALLRECQVTGHNLFYSCVVVPPMTEGQIEYCIGLKTHFFSCSTTLNLPNIMKLSKDPDPYITSPYDPCKFEVQHYILDDICPTLPAG